MKYETESCIYCEASASLLSRKIKNVKLKDIKNDFITLKKISLKKNDELEIGFFDKGKPVNGAKVRHRNIDDIKPGGLGTFSIQQIMDAVVFREGDKPWINHLILTKQL